MSILKKLFGGDKEKIHSPQEAIQRMRDVEETLSKKIDFVEKKIKTEIATAKKYGAKNKRAAIHTLKRKKRLERQLDQINGTLSTIKSQRESLENAGANTAILDVLGVAAEALRRPNQGVDVDKAHNMMDESSEQTQTSGEIVDASYKPTEFEDFDEDNLLEELEQLLQDDLDDHLLKVDRTENLPDIPNVELSEPSSSRRRPQEDDDDIKALEMCTS